MRSGGYLTWRSAALACGAGRLLKRRRMMFPGTSLISATIVPGKGMTDERQPERREHRRADQANPAPKISERECVVCGRLFEPDDQRRIAPIRASLMPRLLAKPDAFGKPADGD